MRRFPAPQSGFVLLYALAFIGMFISFMPYVMVLLPLKATAVGGAERFQVLSAAALGGSLVAGVANIVFGMLSDRSRRRHGTRRPWIGLGLALLLGGYAALHASTSVAALLASVVLLQIALNMMFAPILAIMADEIPDDRKGLVAGLLGTAQPIGSLAAMLVTAPGLGGEGERYALLCGLFTLLIVPFLVVAQETASAPPPPPEPLRARRRADFARAWGSKILLQVAGNALATYGYYYFQSVPGPGGSGQASPDAIVTAMSVAMVVAVGLTIVVGRVSDRTMRRKPFLAAGAATMATGLAIMAGAPGWAAAMLGYGVALCGETMFLATHSALAMQLLPSPDNRGRDLGLLNLTNTFPAMLGPLLGLALNPELHGYGLMLGVLAVVALAGGAVALAVRSQA